MEVPIVQRGLNRRELMKAGAASVLLHLPAVAGVRRRRRPNVVYVFADQWRAQAMGYAGDPNARTPNLDRLAAGSVNFSNAVSCCPVCSPYRASLLTGQYPLTHGVFLNDVRLTDKATSRAQAYRDAGYQTAYIGKWHLDGNRRSGFIPRERRQGFEFWKALGCTAPQRHRDLFNPSRLVLRPNVPEQDTDKAKQAAAGYYAHIAALDDCVGDLLETLRQTGIKRDTIFVFTCDHGDMLYSHGCQNKQRPYDESIRVPFLLRYPALLGDRGATIDMPINSPDIMPTLLGLSGIPVPKTVEGMDFSGVLNGSTAPDNAALIACYAPFGQWTRAGGGREYRGVRTRQYTYVRDLNGPWLLYDNQNAPYQLNNLCNAPEHGDLQARLDALLSARLKETKDDFLPAGDYIAKWAYEVDDTGTVRYTN